MRARAQQSSGAAITGTNLCSPKRIAQRIAVLLVTFPEVAQPDVTAAAVSELYFGNKLTSPSLNRFLAESSASQTTASGQVFGWMTLDRSYTCAETSALLTAAKATAAQGLQSSGILFAFAEIANSRSLIALVLQSRKKVSIC